MPYSHDQVSSYVKGAIAEKLFEVMHVEMGCQVFRTGQEHLYPHLFHLANKKMEAYDKNFGEYAFEKLKDNIKGVPEDVKQDIAIDIYVDEKLGRKESNVALSSSPDYTIITPTAEIRQFEVKYRWNGELGREQLNKYLSLQHPPFIFIFMSQKPFIKILKPKYYKEPKEKDDHSYPLKFVMRKRYTIPTDKSSRLVHDWIDEYGYYEEVQKDKNGLLVIRDPISSYDLVYSPELIAKYSKIIERFYQRNNK